MTTRAWPVKLVFRKSARTVVILFDDGFEGEIAFKTLRTESPSADVRGHGAGPPPAQAPVPDDISIEKAEPVGRYAVRLYFSDGHSTGLYTWALLRSLCSEATPA